MQTKGCEGKDVQVVSAKAESPKGPGLMTGPAGALPWWLATLKSSCDIFCLCGRYKGIKRSGEGRKR